MSDQTGGGFDLNSLLEQAMGMQQQLAAAQQLAASQSVTGHAAGGKVLATMSGSGEIMKVSIAPEVIDPADAEMLEDLIVAAIRDAQRQVAALQEQTLGPLAGGLGGLGEILGG